MIEVKVPNVGESIPEVQVQTWLKKEGDWVASGTDIVDLETEKAAVQLPAPVSGFIRQILKPAEEFAAVGDVLCLMEEAAEPSAASTAPAPTKSDQKATAQPAPAQAPQPASSGSGHVMPAAARMMADNKVDPSSVAGSGPGGRVLKEDVARHVDQPKAPAATKPAQPPVLVKSETPVTSLASTSAKPRSEEIKPMSMIRRTIATRLVQAQQDAALLTTFNEVNMQPVMNLRTKYKDAFLEKHGVKLGFMSFFSKAASEALQRFPTVNAEIRNGTNIVYKNYCDIGIAIGGGKGLVVPVLRNVENMTFATVERTIGEYSKMAMENRLSPTELEGGTFTISNGGVYGSLLSTPIVNPPQSAILGLHAIQDRPIAENGQVVIRPMMYLALSYDHRIIDGREAVTFLRTIKEIIEDPTRLFLEI
jgi:2-oxoglutarate dehydrogenase E2 component (dihydrolipoamide succinyltransferase)